MAKDALDNAVDLISPTISFIRNNFKDLFIKFFKVELVSSLVGIALLILFSIITLIPLLLFAGSLEKIPSWISWSGTLSIAILIVWAVIGICIISWIQLAISSTALIITKEQFEGTYSGIWPLFQRIKFQALGLLLSRTLIMLVCLGIPFAIVFVLPDSTIQAIAMLTYFLYIFLFILVYSFFFHFWEWELFINGKGVFESMTTSISIVTKNMLGVLVFGVFSVIASIIISIPFLVLYFIGEMVFRISVFASISYSSWIMLVPALIIYLIFRLGLTFIQTAIFQAVVYPYIFSFWKSISLPKPSV